INDGQIVRNLRETGMIEAACGAKKTTDMLEEHLSTGDTTRDELLAEYKLQVKRMEKALSISKNDFTKLKIKKVFDNDWEEFTADAGRGFGWALEDAKARVQLLEAGYPASDMYAVSSFVRILSGLESRLSRAQEYINKNEVRDEKTLPDDAKRNLEENREIVREYTPAIAEMRKIWEKAVSGKSLTPAKRLENLRSLRSCAEEIFQNYKVKGTNLKDRSVFELDKLIAAKPSAYDRVMMTGDISEMYTFLGKVDKNVISSDQFSDMKRELKALAEMQKTALANRNVDPFGDTGAAYKKQYDKTLEAISTYLRYKTRQLNNPLKKHTRSEREARRVRMAEAIFSSMKKQNYPGTKTELLNDLAKEHKRAVGDGIDTEMLRPAQEPEKASSKPERVFIRNYKKDGLPVDYDSYINLHTGRAAANGTRQEMIGDLSKVMAAVMLKKKFEKYPGILTAFNLERVHAAAKEIRKEFGLDTIRDDQLRLFLADPSKAARMAGEVSAMQYGLNEKVKPDDYIEQMRRVYLQLPSPISKDGAPRNGAMSLKTNGYRDMFKAVETIAHLPKTTEMEGLDTDRLREKISSCNYQLINGAGKFVLNNAKAASNKKGMSGYTQSAMNAYVTAARSIGCGKSILVDMEFDINEKRMSFGKGSSGYEKGWTQIKTADYGPQKLDEPIETRNINKAVFAKMKSEFKLREKNEKTGSKGLHQNVKKEGNKKLKEIKLPGKK
ncbi:MAG: hypothetical protein J6Y89_09085, partial [Lachnospiraceae bacterium]|nr:hypothetical protein [Lachnospiraceae bacterium]